MRRSTSIPWHSNVVHRSTNIPRHSNVVHRGTLLSPAIKMPRIAVQLSHTIRKSYIVAHTTIPAIQMSCWTSWYNYPRHSNVVRRNTTVQGTNVVHHTTTIPRHSNVVHRSTTILRHSNVYIVVQISPTVQMSISWYNYPRHSNVARRSTTIPWHSNVYIVVQLSPTVQMSTSWYSYLPPFKCCAS